MKFYKPLSMVVASILLLFSTKASAEWKIYNETDSMTDNTIKAAYVENSDGFSFSIIRAKDSKVYADFALPKSLSRLLNTNDMMIYRIDKLKPTEINFRNFKKFTPEFIITRNKSVGFIIWHGDDSEGMTDGSLYNIITGNKLLVRYWTIGNDSYNETEFDISGGKDTILEAIGSKNIKFGK